MDNRHCGEPTCRRRTVLAGLAATATLPAVATGQSASDGWHRPHGDRHNTGSAAVAGPTADLGVAWTRSVDAAVTGQPMPVGDSCVVGTAAGRVHATAIESGEPGWSTALDGERVRTCTPAGDRLVVSTAGNAVYGLDREDGAIDWQISTEAPVTSPLMVEGETVLFGTEQGEVLALDVTDGQRSWRVTLPEEIVGVPAVVDETIVVRDRQGTVAALSLADGEEAWRRAEVVGNLGPAAYADGQVFVCGTTGDGAGRVAARDVGDGSLDWERAFDGQFWTPLAVAHGHVYVFDNRGTLWALDPADGATDWQVQFDEQVALAAAEDALYVLTRAALAAYDPTDGAERDRFHPGDQLGDVVSGHEDAVFTGGPTPISRGALLASEDGRIWAVRGGSGGLPLTALAGGAGLTGLAAYGLYRWRRAG